MEKMGVRSVAGLVYCRKTAACRPSQFKIRSPVYPKAHLRDGTACYPSSSSKEARVMALLSRNIAIVDDDLSIRTAISRLLKTAGMRTICYSSGLQFLNRFARSTGLSRTRSPDAGDNRDGRPAIFA